MVRTMAIDWYNEFVDTSYEPAKDDLVCLFYFEPAAGISNEEAAGRITSERLNGHMDNFVYHAATDEKTRSKGILI